MAKVRLAVLCWPGSAIVKEPLSIEAVKALTAKWSYPGAPLWTPTLATYCIIAHAGFLLYSDAAVVLVTVVRDVKSMKSDDDDEYMDIFVCKRKTDQFRAGNVVSLSRQALPTAVQRSDLGLS